MSRDSEDVREPVWVLASAATPVPLRFRVRHPTGAAGNSAGDDAATIVARWQPGLQLFLALREHYLLYPDVPLPAQAAGMKPADDEPDGTGGIEFPFRYREVRE